MGRATVGHLQGSLCGGFFPAVGSAPSGCLPFPLVLSCTRSPNTPAVLLGGVNTTVPLERG
jgi:hypothetical protein